MPPEGRLHAGVEAQRKTVLQGLSMIGLPSIGLPSIGLRPMKSLQRPSRLRMPKAAAGVRS